MPRPLKYLLWFLVALVGLVAIYYQIANWAGRRAWAKTQAELRAAGEPVTQGEWAARFPVVPPEDNFCAIDLLRGVTEVEDGDEFSGESAEKRQRLEELDARKYFEEHFESEDVPRLGNFRSGIEWSLSGSESNPNGGPKENALKQTTEERVASYLDEFEDVFVELDESNHRRHAVFVPAAGGTLDRESISLLSPAPFPKAMLSLHFGLGLRMFAALDRGDGETCRQSVITLLRLAEANANEHRSMATICSILQMRMADDGLFRYLNGKWYTGEEDLGDLSVALNRLNYRETFREITRTEWVVGTECLTWFQRSTPSNGYRWPTLDDVYVWGPSGWIDQNKANLCRMYYSGVMKPDEESGRGFLGIQRRTEENVSKVLKAKSWWNPCYAGAAIFAESTATCLEPVAYAETIRVQDLTALTLEYYLLRRGEYPEGLEELPSEFLIEPPLDPMDGQVMRYRKTANGYLLYSVGWDGVDDGGAVDPGSQGAGKPSIASFDYKGDWVWEIKRNKRDNQNAEKP